MSSSSSSSLKDFLTKHSIDEIEKDQELVYLSSNESIESAFQKIVERGVLCAPVKDRQTGKFVGLVDAKDFVEYVLLIYGQSRASVEDLNLAQGLNIRSILNLSKTNPLVPIASNGSLLDALQRFQSGLHRLAVTQDDTITRMLSQMSMLKYLVQQKEELGHLVNTRIGDLSIGSEPKVISWTQTGLDALSMIDSEGISGTAIVNDQGNLFGSISVSDLKYAAPNTDTLTLSLQEFWKGTQQPLVTATPDDSLATSMQKLVDNNVHRLFVVDENSKPTKVISITDITNLFAANAQ